MIFWVQAPLLALSALLAWFIIPETARRTGVHFDVRGQAVLFVVARMAAVRHRPGCGVGVRLAVGARRRSCWRRSSTWWFVRGGAAPAHPLIPMGWFRRRGFAVPVFVSFFMQFGYMGGFTLTPKLLDEVRGLGADAISLMMIPRPLTFAIAGPVAGMLAVYISARTAIAAGMASLAVSMALFAIIAPDPTTFWVVTALTLSGIGVGASLPRLSASVANSVEDVDLGVAGATQQLLAQIGTTVGINLLETVQVATLGCAGLAGSYRIAYGAGRGASARWGSWSRSDASGQRPACQRYSVIVLDLRGDLRRGRIDGAGLHGHELRHVALDLDLAGHERLHAGLRVALDQDRLGGHVVEGHGQVGTVEVTEVHL